MKSDFLSGDRLKVLIVVILGTFMAAMDSSIVNVSIPSMMTFFHASVEDVEWVITSYMLGFAVFMPLTGWFRDRIGNKKLYLWSLGIFTMGSLLCGIAWNLPTLIIARLIQSFGGGAIMPTSMAIIGEHFKQHERGKVLGYWGVGVVIGPAIGPTIGGILTEYFGWRSIFLINLPIGIFAILYSLKVIKRDLPHLLSKNPFDRWGFISFGSFLTLFLLAVSFAERVGFDSPRIILSLFISLVFFVLFVLIEMKVKNPLLDFQLFKNSDFTKCILITCVRSVGLFGSVFLMPVFFQHVLLKSETETGMLLFPSSVLLALTLPFAGHLNDKYGPRLLSVTGLVFLSSFMFFYGNLWPGMNSFELIWPTLFRGLGLGLLVAPITATTINAVPKIKIAMASTMSSIVQQTSASIGIAILASIYSHRLTSLRNTGMDQRMAELKALELSFLVAGLIMASAIYPAFKLPKFNIHKKGNEDESIVLE